MRVHHLNCGLMAPLGGALFDGVSRGPTARLTCHCLLIETGRELVLVDTGFGLKDVRHPYRRLSAFFVLLDNIRFDPDLTAIRQVEALGYDPRDVRHVVMTHLDFDHAGGLEDFPWAHIHVSARELAAAERATGFRDTRRYPRGHLDGVRHWRTYPAGGARWFGFEAARELRGLPPEILLVGLPGHTAGHCGVAIRDGDGWLLHAGDAYFFRREMDGAVPRRPPATAAYEYAMAADYELFLHSQARLREAYRGSDGLAVFCTHDPVEFEALRRVNAAALLGTGAPAARHPASGRGADTRSAAARA